MASAWEFWLTPTISLSLIIEAESSVPSVTRFLSQWALYFQPRLLGQALDYEIEQRPQLEVISAGTLRVVDYAYFRHNTEGYQSLQGDGPLSEIAASERVENPSTQYELLRSALERVESTYALVTAASNGAQQQFSPDGSSDDDLKRLWKLLKPDLELPGLIGKHWQEVWLSRLIIRVEPNVSPATDFRGVGMLALESLLYFAVTYGERACEIVDEAVNGGTHWYPLALASIHMTEFALDLATKRDLQLFLLRSVQAPREARAASAERQDYTALLRIASDLLLLFHEHWKQGSYTVMQFEQVERDFRNALRPWIRRGVLDGRALGWEKWDEGGIKLD
ncbi:ELMO domain-containing protein [Sporobolomyces koalae]|uniref:ELMO domain-containing protein n=1 Tax=Sporobolomyces koalae TaxID=500713 RepID=UPI0031738964